MSPARLEPGQVHEAEGARARRRMHLALLLRAGAVLLVVWLLGRLLDVVWPESLSSAAGRTSYSYKADGYRGSLEFARALGHGVQAKRTSYGQAPATDAGVLVMIDPLPLGELERTHQQGIDRSQKQALERWLEDGGRILATVPARTILTVSAFGASLELDDEDAPDSGGETVLEDVLNGGLPESEWIETQGELAWEAPPGGVSERWTFPGGSGARLAAPFLASEPGAFRFPNQDGAAPPPKLQVFREPVPDGCEILARLDGKPFVLRRQQGSGQAWLVASAWPFSNLALARHGTAGFVARLFAEVSADEARVLYFDEYGHGLWERGGWLFWLRKDVLLYPALGLGVLALLFLWRGSQRFGAPAADPEPARRAKEEFVLGLADVAQRAGRHRAAARSLLSTYQARLAEHGLDAASEPGWARLYPVSSYGDAPARFGLAELQTLAREADALYQRQLAAAGVAARKPAAPSTPPRATSVSSS